MHILVVDDEAPIRMVVGATFPDATVHEAPDGPSALALLRDVHVDVVLLDVMMPTMDGFAVLQRIRRSSRHAELPVVMLTARVGEGDHLAAFRAGADAYLTKPFDIEALEQTVTAMVGSTSQERAARREAEIARAVLLREIEQHFG